MPAFSALCQALDEALLSAYPDRPSLTRMLRYANLWELDQITGNGGHADTVLALVKYAESQGALRTLFDAARKANADNPGVKGLARRWPRLLAEGDVCAAVEQLPRWTRTDARRDDLRLVVSTYNAEENVDDHTLFLLHEPMSSRGERWEETFGGRLTAIREALARRGDTRDLRLTLACTPAAAVRAGFVFNSLGRFTVTTAGTTANALTGTFPSGPAGDTPRCEVAWPGDGDELHVVVSVSRDARTLHKVWRDAGGPAANAVLSVRPEGEFGDTAIVDSAHAQQWATTIRRAIVSAQSEAFDRGQSIRRTRVFLAGPVTLAFAVGRELNGSGAITLMDFDREAKGYVAAIDFVT